MSTIYFQRLMLVPPATVAPAPLDVCVAIVVLRAAIVADVLRPYFGAQAHIRSLIPGWGAWTRDYVAWVMASFPLRGPRALPVRVRACMHAVLQAFGAPQRRLP